MLKHKFETIKLELDQNGIATLTINRPTKLNALNNKVLTELEEAIQEINDRDEIKVVILTGEGDKAFVAGADISELRDLNEPRGTVAAERGQEVFAGIEKSSKPFIALVNGYALGGGSELALACHIRIATKNAVFGLPEVTLGLIPGYGGTQRLTHILGKGRAFELILTGNIFDASKALEFGLVNYVGSKDEMKAKAEELANTIISRAPLAVRNALKSINATDEGVEKGYRTEAELFGNLCATKDFEEGTSAFLEKRKAEFVGN